jgi:hypothetical protein
MSYNKKSMVNGLISEKKLFEGPDVNSSIWISEGFTARGDLLLADSLLRKFPHIILTLT